MRVNFLWILMLMQFHAAAQDVYVEAGKIISIFDYTNSTGDEIELQKGIYNSIGLGFRGPFESSGGRLYLNLGLSLNKYGATGSDTVLANSYEWDVNYLGINIGLEFDLLEFRAFQFYLKGEEEFDGVKVFLKGGGGINYSLKENVTVFAYYLVANNLFNIGSDKSDGEKLKILTHNINIGVFLHLQNHSRFR